MDNSGHWRLHTQDGWPHECPVRVVKETTCKYCKRGELWWSKETATDGTIKNVLMESYGLPHGCDERKAHFDAISQAKKDEYAREKDRVNSIPNGTPCGVCSNGSGADSGYVRGLYSRSCRTCGGSGKVSDTWKKRTLFDIRKRIWPNIGRTADKRV